MKSWFSSLTIRSKLIFIILLINFLIVAFVGGIRIVWDVQQARLALTQDLSALAKLLGDRSSAALAFDDASLAQENLASLKGLPHVVQACLYRSNASLLAQFHRDLQYDNTTSFICSSTNHFTEEQIRFDEYQLHLITAIEQDNQTLGWIYLGSDLSAIDARLRDEVTFSGLALLSAILLSWLLAAWMQRLISKPIAAVTEVARTIEERGNYQLRAPTSSDDEVGRLARSFNAMLDALEAQNQQLVTAKVEQQAASSRYRGLVESTSAIPWELDLDSGQLIYVGHQAEVVLGYPVKEWYQDNFWSNHLHPLDRNASIAGRNSTFELVQNHQLEYRMLAANGKIVWIHDDVQVALEDGKPVRLHGFMFDISVRKEMEDELRRHRDELESLVEQRTAELKTVNQELESFSYSVSHDLRAPLRSISGFSHAIMDDYNSVLDSEGQELLTRVIDNAKRMAELIDDLLELSRLGRKELHTIQIDFNRLVNDISQSYLRNQEQHEVKFTCEDLGSVTGDLGLLKVVIDNLLGNAWKYTAKVDKACITVGKQHTAGEDVFFIKDNGAGFDMNYVNKIFGAFQRLHKRDEFEGTGIGLATVQRIIHRHGGRIWAEAKPGKGATFYFTLGPAKNITTEAPSDILVQSE